jgi:phosphate transport system substrate-binding protein
MLAAMAGPAPAQDPTGATLTGAGSTFAQPLMARWGQSYASLQGEGGVLLSAEAAFDYEPVGSTGGIARLIARGVDFAVSDAPMPPEELDRHGLAQFPIVTGGVAVAVNLAGVAALRLSPAVVAGIYLGEIARWSDPAVAALNPGVTLPEAPITVLRRADGSGTTFAFSRWLAAEHAPWRDRVGFGQVLAWPVGAGIAGNRDLAAAVRNSPNAIAYVEAGQAERAGLTMAALANRAGAFVMPTPRGLGRATGQLAMAPGRHFFHDTGAADDAEAYPVIAIVYALMPRQPRSQARARRALEFFRLGMNEGAGDAAALGYVALPPETVAQVAQYWRATIRGAR